MDEALNARIAQARAGQAGAMGEIIGSPAERQPGGPAPSDSWACCCTSRVDAASDIVQQSFNVRRSRRSRSFKVRRAPSSRRWLHRILEHNLGARGPRPLREQPDEAIAGVSSRCAAVARPGESEVLVGDEFAASVASPSTRAMEQEQAGMLARLLADLPADQQMAVRLRSEGMPLAEIARQLGRSSSAAASLISWRMRATGSKVQTRPSAEEG